MIKFLHAQDCIASAPHVNLMELTAEVHENTRLYPNYTTTLQEKSINLISLIKMLIR